MTDQHDKQFAHFEAHAQKLSHGSRINLEYDLRYQSSPGIHTYVPCDCKTALSRGGYGCRRCITRAIEIKQGIPIEDSPLLAERLKKEIPND